ncbi:MAG: hypothetical protein ACOY3Z_11890 [Thermodesulfobacteriota bacterium]
MAARKGWPRGMLTVLALTVLAGCGQAPEQKAEARAVAVAAPSQPGCLGCHPLHLDANHNLACTACHGGDNSASEQQAAHAGLISHPAHPDRMLESCGRCHGQQVRLAAASAHFTLANEVNLVRQAFGASDRLSSPRQIPVPGETDTPLALVDDMLRRRCLRCHVYSSGDAYPETRRGTGCAACHLAYGDGAMQGHGFVKSPPDSQCLHCHYGNFVGADSHGRFEHDFGVEYRTPYRASGDSLRPYGVEFHQLAADVHQKAGMACIDCHSGAELMGGHGGDGKGGRQVSCRSCHARGQGESFPGLHEEKGEWLLTARLSGKRLVVPQLRHPAHRRYGGTVHCTVCHGQWSVSDQATHLLRLDRPDFERWSELTVQGSSEVEERLASEEAMMQDGFTGEARQGLWLMGFGLRRWEQPLIGKDEKGMLRLHRPILDLRLSMVDSQGMVRFDNLAPIPAARRFLPYSPHTVGKAGAFYQERLKVTLPAR